MTYEEYRAQHDALSKERTEAAAVCSELRQDLESCDAERESEVKDRLEYYTKLEEMAATEQASLEQRWPQHEAQRSGEVRSEPWTAAESVDTAMNVAEETMKTVRDLVASASVAVSAQTADLPLEADAWVTSAPGISGEPSPDTQQGNDLEDLVQTERRETTEDKGPPDLQDYVQRELGKHSNYGAALESACRNVYADVTGKPFEGEVNELAKATHAEIESRWGAEAGDDFQEQYEHCQKKAEQYAEIELARHQEFTRSF